MYARVQESFTNTTNICKDIVEELNGEEKKRLILFGRYSFKILRAKKILVSYKGTFDKNR